MTRPQPPLQQPVPSADTPVGDPYYGPVHHSRVKVRFADGGFRTVGTAAQPLLVRGPEGWRVYPGSTYPLMVKQSDGTWLPACWTT